MIKTEREYILQLQDDSNEAFEYLYNTYSPRLYGFVYNLTRSSHMADEVVQESFIKIWENRRNVIPDFSFKSYLFMIARNHVINVFRKQVYVKNMEKLDELQNDISLSDNNSESLAETNDLKAYIENAKKHLTPRQLQIFELSKEKGLSNQEIADLLNISNQSVKNQLSASLKVLQSYFSTRMWILLPLLCNFLRDENSF